MGRRDKRKGGSGEDRKGRWMRLAPDPAEVAIAWANLVGAIVMTMIEEGVGADAISSFLEHLDFANMSVLEGKMLTFVLHVTEEYGSMVPSND